MVTPPRRVAPLLLPLLLRLLLLVPAACPTVATGAAPVDAALRGLAFSYQRFEQIYARIPPDERPVGPARAALAQRLDQVTRAFFSGAFGRVRETLDRAAAHACGRAEDAALLGLLALDAAVVPAVHDADRAAAQAPTEAARIDPATHRVIRLSPAWDAPARDADADRIITLTVTLRRDGDPAAAVRQTVDLPPAAFARGAPVHTAPFDITGLPEALWRIDVQGADGFTAHAGSWLHTVPPALDDTAERLRAHLDRARAAHERARSATEIPTDPAAHTALLEDALDVAASRLARLRDTPRADVTGIVLDRARLRRDLEREIAALDQGRDPYHAAAVDLWFELPLRDGAAMPCRLLVPPAAAGRRGDGGEEGRGAGTAGDDDGPPSPRPLLILLHGMGGNEHLFMDGHGGGMIPDRARREGWIVVAPSTMAIGRDGAFERLLDFIRSRWPVDHTRIAVIGHSMGGGMATRLVSAHPETIRTVVAIAGAGVLRTPPSVRARFYGAALDTIVPASRVRQAAEASRRGADGGGGAGGGAGGDGSGVVIRTIEYIELPDADHLLCVAEALESALRFAVE